MGLTYVTTEVRSLTGKKKPFVTEFLVDTGAIDCMAPASALHQAGIYEESKSLYELADNSTVEYPIGFVRIKFMGNETVAQIIFGPEECEPILGVVALGNVGIGIDPANKSMYQMRARPLK